MDFEWDEEKAAGNHEKHGVSFADAATVFDDPLYVDFYDPDHSSQEHRYPMKKVESELEDELRPEYDLRSLRVRKLGPGRKSFGDVVRLEPDVADAFPDADAVNQALRFLIRVTKENQNALRPTKGDA